MIENIAANLSRSDLGSDVVRRFDAYAGDMREVAAR